MSQPNYTIDFRAIESAEQDLVGGKGANLGRLTSAGFEVPPGFTVSTTAYRDFLRLTGLDAVVEQYCQEFDYDDPSGLDDLTTKLRSELTSASVPPEIAGAIAAAYGGLGVDAFVAVRSSGTAEDLAEASFAGQHDTYLDISGEDAVISAVKRCWASLWTARATAYRARNGIDHGGVAIAIVVQTMVPSQVAGVLFTGNPMTAATDEMVINASWGLGEGVVSGITQPDEFVVAADTLQILTKRLGEKAVMVVRDPAAGVGTVEADVPGVDRSRFCLTDAEVARLAQLGRRVTEYYDRIPQDIEWALVDGRLFLLQSRPITGVPFAWPEDLEPWQKYSDPDAVWSRAWSDAFWTGAITPMMYSYRAKCFNEMYSFAMKTYGVTELVKIPWMKYYKGEAYYNAAAEPIIARTFPRALRNGLLETATPPEKERAATEPMNVRGFLKWHARSLLDPTMNPIQYVNVMMEKISGDTSRVDGLTADQLSALSDRALRRYCDDLVDFEIEFCLQNVSMMWIAPYLMNSLAHMVEKWAGMGPETFGALVTGNPERSATSDENLWLWRLARKLHADPELRALFADNPDGAFFAAAQTHPTGATWLAEYREFAAVHHHRGHADRDICLPRRCEDPSIDYNSLKAFLTADDTHDPESTEQENTRRREAAYAQVLSKLRGNFLGAVKAEAFKGVHAEIMRVYVYRDHMRYYIDRSTYSLRRGILELADRLVQRGLLNSVDQIWFLGFDEVYDLLEGRVNLALTQAKIATRKADFDAIDSQDVVRPAFLQQNRELTFAQESRDDSTGVLHGYGTSPGTVIGTARVVKSLKEIGKLSQGDILVCHATDPGWTPVFLVIAGAVIETGGMLAHASCLAREYGFPAIQLESAMQRIPDGATIQLDGNTGQVTILEERSATPAA
ncbi:PEP/pyruvate-binding domain-containing protein [Sporichthya polymorpha]|uniref:PEP/pyruvate-binding domain-containing protein n=1 Tax=Sporichthya polymorpha TaxID=35751 RepID=UPI0012EBBB21|nr:PEP/pyruvate-binding domain-containing protein [Sporichthya polymorpha]